MPSPFGSLVDTFLKEEYEDSPTLATSLGLTEYDDRLDDTSAARFQKRIERDDAWLDRFRGVGEARASVGRPGIGEAVPSSSVALARSSDALSCLTFNSTSVRAAFF